MRTFIKLFKCYFRFVVAKLNPKTEINMKYSQPPRKKQIKKARMLLSIDPGFQRNECISAVSQKEPEFIRRKHHNGFEPPEKYSFLR